MSLITLGLNHKTTPVDMRERLAFTPENLSAATKSLASLDCVDHLVVFPETTPDALLEALRPDILVKGANYCPDEVAGHEIVERCGGRVELVPIQSEVSVSGLVNHIVQRFGRDERSPQ